MFDPKQLLEQVLGAQRAGNAQDFGRDIKSRLDRAGGANAFAGGALTGGLLGMLLGGKAGRKMTKGLAGYGGAAVLGALAMQAYQAYQRSQAGQQQHGNAKATFESALASLGTISPASLPHAQPAADGGAFELVLVKAMVGAAKADGHIDAAEQRRLFQEVDRLGLDAEAKGYVFDLLTRDVELGSLAQAVATQEQGAELYLAARLVIDPDEPAERAYLDALASRLQLPQELRARLDAAAASGVPAA
jgi:uncharacterized membrane protein YebE (DUF533 family)